MTEQKMQAVRIQDYGGPEVLTLGEAPRPEPPPGQLLVRVKAAGVNPADSAFRRGAFKQFMALQFPWTPGLEGAGVVEAVGQDVATFRPGQEVYRFVTGAYAQYALAKENDLQLKPSHLTMEEAASTPMGATIGWAAVIETAKPKRRFGPHPWRSRRNQFVRDTVHIGRKPTSMGRPSPESGGRCDPWSQASPWSPNFHRFRL